MSEQERSYDTFWYLLSNTVGILMPVAFLGIGYLTEVVAASRLGPNPYAGPQYGVQFSIIALQIVCITAALYVYTRLEMSDLVERVNRDSLRILAFIAGLCAVGFGLLLFKDFVDNFALVVSCAVLVAPYFLYRHIFG